MDTTIRRLRALLKTTIHRAAIAATGVRRDPQATPLEAAYIRRRDALFAHHRANGALSGHDVLALAATRGKWRTASLESALRRARTRRITRAVLSHVRLDAYLQLATLLADQRPPEHADAALLLREMSHALGPQKIRKEGRFRLLELQVEAGETRELPALLARHTIGREDMAQPFLLTANAHNPFRSAAHDRDNEEWGRTLEAMYEAEGLEGIEIVEGDAAPFDRVRASAHNSVDGPLVTVIIPTYDPGPRLATAVESLLAQSHRNLQILIMDDASPADAAIALDGWRERDPRIEVVHLPVNNGPYFARNVAASQRAHGDYVTIHDDDDWSHPRKIELQVAHLESHAAVANMSFSVRASDDLRFGRVNGNPVWTQQGLNTLMVRREVFERVGYWDVLNRSADAEFNDRIRAWTGSSIPVVGRVPLTLYRVRWDSLSAGEFNRGYMDPRRRWYSQSYLQWHRTCVARGETPYLPADDRVARPFSVPRDLVGSRSQHRSSPLSLDMLVAGDFRLPSADALADEIKATLDRGLRVGLMQLDSPATAPDARLRPRILEVALHTDVVSTMDAVSARVAVVTDPSTLQFLRTGRSALSTDRLVMMDRAEHVVRDDERLFELDDVTAAARALFGHAPEIVPAAVLSSLV